MPLSVQMRIIFLSFLSSCCDLLFTSVLFFQSTKPRPGSLNMNAAACRVGFSSLHLEALEVKEVRPPRPWLWSVLGCYAKGFNNLISIASIMFTRLQWIPEVISRTCATFPFIFQNPSFWICLTIMLQHLLPYTHWLQWVHSCWSDSPPCAETTTS